MKTRWLWFVLGSLLVQALAVGPASAGEEAPGAGESTLSRLWPLYERVHVDGANELRLGTLFHDMPAVVVRPDYVRFLAGVRSSSDSETYTALYPVFGYTRGPQGSKLLTLPFSFDTLDGNRSDGHFGLVVWLANREERTSLLSAWPLFERSSRPELRSTSFLMDVVGREESATPEGVEVAYWLYPLCWWERSQQGYKVLTIPLWIQSDEQLFEWYVVKGMFGWRNERGARAIHLFWLRIPYGDEVASSEPERPRA